MSHQYAKECAAKYIGSTLESPYTVHKNRTIAELLAELLRKIEVPTVFDLGGNVSGLIKKQGSLRFQLEQVSIKYYSLDLVPEYFSIAFAQSLGVENDNIFGNRIGVVGDLRSLPMASQSLEAVVAADVIEHIPNPSNPISEIKRVLQPEGLGVIVVPSLYKLDTINAPYIREKRYSSHANKFTFSEWISIIQDSGLTIDMNLSRPLGILSGLLYMTWLDSRFVPQKDSKESEEIFSDQANLFKEIKRIVSSFDPEMDNYLLQHPHEMDDLAEMIKNGEIVALIAKIRQLLLDRLECEQVSLFDEMLCILQETNFDRPSLSKIQSAVSENGNFFLGNSVLLIVRNN